MKTEHIRVYVNDQPVTLYRGMQVKHALIAHDPALYEAARQGNLLVLDAHGFRVGLEGALHEGSKLFTQTKQSGG